MREDWKEIEISKAGSIITGNTPPKKNIENYNSNDFPFYKPTDLEAGKNVIKSNDYLSKTGFENSRIAPTGSILVTCIGATIGKTGLIKKNGGFNQQINAVIPFNGIDSSYVFYQIKGTEFQNQIIKNASSTTLPILNKNKFSQLKFKLAPLPEQKIIVSKIEQLFSELDNGIANLESAKEKLEVYRQAVLKKAFEGELTEVWRSERLEGNSDNSEDLLIAAEQKPIYKNKSLKNNEVILPRGWRFVNLEDIGEIGTGATPKRGNLKYWENGAIPWITSSVVNFDYVNSAKEFISEAAVRETNCKIVPKGSLLVAMYGEGKTRGKVTELNIDSSINQALASIKVNEKIILKQFVKWLLKKNYNEIRLKSSGGVQPNLNLSIVKKIEVPFPTLSEQTQIVQEIESRLSICDKLAESINESLEKSEALRQSILKKAFAGELLTEKELEACKQEADWEPAEKLLERIKNSI